MKILARVLIFFLGVFTACIFFWLRPDYGAAQVYNENTALHVRAHMICFESIIANWAQSDSTYIPLDSLEKEYLSICGAMIDSLITN